MKILFIQKKTNTGGSKESLLHTIKLLRNAGHAVSVLCSYHGYFTDRLKSNEVPFQLAYVPEYRKFFDRLRFSRHIARIMSCVPVKEFDWIISNEMWWAPVAAALAKGQGANSAVIIRTLVSQSKFEKYDLHSLDKVICVNPAMKENLANDPDNPVDACTVFNPVMLEETDNGALKHWRNIIDSWPGVNMTFLMTGSIGRLKNQSDAVRTIQLLSEYMPDKSPGLICAGSGSGEYIKHVKTRALEAGISGHVLFPGHIDNIHALLEAVDCFIFTSLREGLPRSLIEALMAGLPAFSYPLPGIEEIYGDRLNSFVCSRQTPESLAQKIKESLCAKGLHGDVEKLRERVKARFSEQNHLERLISVLESP